MQGVDRGVERETADGDTAGSGRAHRAPARPAYLASLAAPVVLFGLAAWQRRWVQEDGFINLRIVEQVMHGHGPVFNAGQRVEAFTSPLWLGILVVLRALVGWAIPMEWVAVLAGIALAVLGVTGVVAGCGQLQTVRRKGREVKPPYLVPAGIIVVLALPPMWDFASSGLESGLAMGWIGGSFWCLARLARIGNRRKAPPPLPLAMAFLFGLGPLVRPELALYSLSFAAAAILLTSHDRARLLRAAAAFFALPVLYQVFRMGFYAGILPNTALAKDAGGTAWTRGFDYLRNFTNPYHLLLPLAGLVALTVVSRPQRANPSWKVVALATAVPATLQVLYIVRIGGDYMHGRFFVVPVLALIAPVAMVPLELRTWRWQAQAPLLVGLVVWAGFAAFTWRPPVLQVNGTAIDDQRAAVVAYTHNRFPVRATDQPDFFVHAGQQIGRQGHGDVLLYRPNLLGDATTRLPRQAGTGPAAKYDAIGVAGYLAGTRVQFIDVLGLADLIAPRLPAASSNRAGHSHSLPDDWLAAEAKVRPGLFTPAAKDAARALRCGDLKRLMDDTTRPLTVGRFFANLLDAPANTTLKIPKDTAQAVQQFCGR